jgi:glucose uptake protein GlcU
LKLDFILKYIFIFLGALWSTGNLVTVFCIKTCGLAVGLLIWATTSLVMGWAGGRFGLLGVNPQIPATTTKLALNYTSVILAAVSAIFFLFIKSSNAPRTPRSNVPDSEQAPVEMVKSGSIPVETEEILETDFPFLNKLSDPVQKTLGCFLAAAAGIFYGLMFIPDQYIRDHPEKFIYKNNLPPNNGLYYVSSQYAGILFTSLFYFILYTLFKRNKPVINPSIALPAMISGVMWAVANIGFIVAISALKSAVAYPIVSVLPGIVTSLWSLFWFREIQGKRNYIFLGCGMLVRVLAAILSGLSA